MSSRKYRFYSADAHRSKLHIACSDFCKSQSAFIALLLLSKLNPLRWISIWFWAQSRKKIDLPHLLQDKLTGYTWGVVYQLFLLNIQNLFSRHRNAHQSLCCLCKSRKRPRSKGCRLYQQTEDSRRFYRREPFLYLFGMMAPLSRPAGRPAWKRLRRRWPTGHCPCRGCWGSWSMPEARSWCAPAGPV